MERNKKGKGRLQSSRPSSVESGLQLAMAAVASAAVEPIAAMESAVAAAETFTTESAIAATEAFVSVEAAAPVKAMAVITTTVEAATMEPRAGADEDAADEIVRPVVAVRRTGVGIVAVVTVGADRRGTDGAVNGANPDADANLRVGAARRGEKQDPQQCNIF